MRGISNVCLKLLRAKRPPPTISRNKLNVSEVSENFQTISTSVEVDEKVSLSSGTEKSYPWSFVPPTKFKSVEETRGDADIIPVKFKVLLTSAEIVEALEKLGGVNPVVINVFGCLEQIETFVICTGTSTQHIRKMSDAIVRGLKSRELRQAYGFTGAEGEKDDDWIVIDCFNHAVHLLTANTRAALDLETLWTNPIDMPLNTEEAVDKLVEQNPVPDWYNPEGDKTFNSIKTPNETFTRKNSNFHTK